MHGCGNIPSTEEINNDLETINAEIEKAQNTSNKYEGGLIKVLTDLRMELLKNTKSMLEQKKKGLNRFVKINYTIDGKVYKRPGDFQNEISRIDDEITSINKQILNAQIKSDNSGGLIQAMIEVEIATLKNSLTLLEQKKLSLKYEFPIYITPLVSGQTEESIRKSMKGTDLDNL